VGRVADRGVVHAEVVADGPDHDGAGVEAHAEGQGGVSRDAELLAALAEGALDRQGGEDGAAGVVLVSQRGAELGHEAVPEELVDRALVAVDLAQG
jgi:hypothetical protein